MPFTFAHPAAVLPFIRSSLSMTGLVIGSMVPDFEYFCRLKVSSTVSHTIPGIFIFDLPLGLLLALAFHGIVYRNLYANLPQYVRARLPYPDGRSWLMNLRKSLPRVLVSLIVGTMTHLFWDAFTHQDGFFVHQFDLLSREGINGIPVFKFLQHASTVTGFIILGLFFCGQPSKPHSTTAIPLYWPVIFLCIFILLVLKLCMTNSTAFGDIIVTLISGVLLGLIVGGFLRPLQAKAL